MRYRVLITIFIYLVFLSLQSSSSEKTVFMSNNTSTNNLLTNDSLALDLFNKSLSIEEFLELNKCKLSQVKCENLPTDCLTCSIDKQTANCNYGSNISTTCTAKEDSICIGERSFKISFNCQFCYQTPDWMHICAPNISCKREGWKRNFKTNCTIKDGFFCLGSRTFYKKIECDWSSGYKWSTTMALSIFVGGFGADRFYLGHYKEGFGKLFSFGGLGIWTLIDVILIYCGYLVPADGSLYI